MDAMRRGRAWGTAAVVAAVALPVAIIAATRDDRSVGDITLMELRIRDVLSSHPPLTGAYSRYGWSHPGPLLFDLFALPFRVLGNDADALRWTTLGFNVITVVALLWVVRRRGVAAWCAVAAATLLLSWGLIPHSLSDGWNAAVVVLPFLLTVVACWCALCGDRWSLLVAVLSFVFVFQGHIGFGLVLVPLVGVVLVVRAVRALRARRRPGLDSVAAAAVVVVLFLPVIYDTLANWPGNMGRLVKWSWHNDETKVGVGESLRVIGRTASLSFLGHPPVPRFVLTVDAESTGFLPYAALVLLAVATWIAWRRGYSAELVLCWCLWLVWAAGAFAAANIAEPLLPWLIDWLQPLGWLTWAALALVAWRVVQGPLTAGTWWPQLRTAGIAVAAIAFVAGAADYWHETVTTRYLSADAKPALDALTSGNLVWGDGPIPIVYEGDPLTAGTMMHGIVNTYDRRGQRLCVQADLAFQFSEWRVCTGDAPGYLLVRDEAFVTPPPDGATTVAISDPLSPDERTEADRLSEELATVLVETGHEDLVYVLYSSLAEIVLDRAASPELLERSDDVARLDALRQIRGARYGLYFVPT
ncbi:MAG: hypothetical protein HZB15_11380 [Actinobacteria bacterium]|nr:hypothetical protein [Actinomycetota bacterium]